MTKATGKQPAPTALLAMMIAIEGLEAPERVFAVVTSIQAAISDENPRSALSKRCSRLREARPGVFREVWRWLMTAEVRDTARRNGACWAWRVWCKACAAIDRGVKPHVAFGMNKPGRPVKMHFTAADDVALYAEYLHQCCGELRGELRGELTAEGRALAASSDMTASGEEVARSSVQRARKDYKSCGDSLTEVPAALRMKYPAFKG